MAVYQFNCPKCGEFEVFKTIKDNLLITSCPTCTSQAKRLFYPPSHFWQGMMSPGYEYNTSDIRFKNNSKIYGEPKAAQIERDWANRSS